MKTQAFLQTRHHTGIFRFAVKSLMQGHRRFAPWSGKLVFQQAAICSLFTVCILNECIAQSKVSSEEPVKIVEPQLLRLRDPALSVPAGIRKLPTAYLQLWIEALSGSEYELKREVAMSITRAHRDGYLDCSTAEDSLLEILDDPAAPRSVLVEVARALITLDARDSATRFKVLLRRGAGTQFEMLVEPTLARWGDSEMRSVWKQRLTSKDVTNHRKRLALTCIPALPRSMTSDEQLQASLQSLIRSSRDLAIILEASKTLGQIQQTDLEPLARQLLFQAEATSPVSHLAGVYLLLHQESQSSQELLLQAVTESLDDPRQGPMIRIAWVRLLERNVSELSSLAPQALENPDPAIRRKAIDTLLKFPSEEGVALLGTALDDRHPDNRRTARQSLLALSKNESFDQLIRQAGLAAISRTSWREQEQAIMLLALLDQKESAKRMLQLISSPRADVAIAAAWGLRKLNDPANLEPVLRIAETLDQQISKGQTLLPHQSIVLAHLFEALGKAKYKPGIPLLKEWIPKGTPRFSYEEPRSSAFWAIGWLHENSNDVALAQQLKTRFLDVNSLEAECTTVRYTAAIALGRIGVTEVTPDLELFAEYRTEEADLAAAWAVERLTGREISPPKPPTIAGAPWKLSPIGSRLEADSTNSVDR